MAVQLRSGKELSNIRVEKREKTEQEEEEEETGRENRKNGSKLTAETENQVQTKEHGGNCEQKQKEKVKDYMPAVSFPQRLLKAKKEEQISIFMEIFKKIEINIPFYRGNKPNAKLCQIPKGHTE